jgi:hypothetical protein
MNNIQELELNKDFLDNANLQVVDFILAQGEKSLQNTIRIADNATDRAYRLLTILLPIMIPVIVGFFQNDNFIRFTALFAFIFLGMSILYCGIVIFSYKFKPQAQYIDYLISPQVFQHYDLTQAELSYKSYLIWVLRKMHHDTEFNRIQNITRLYHCNFAIILALLSLSAPIIARIILFYFV